MASFTDLDATNTPSGFIGQWFLETEINQ